MMEIIITKATFFCVCGFSFILVFFHDHWAIPEKKRTKGVEDMEFPGVLKKKEVGFPGVN